MTVEEARDLIFKHYTTYFNKTVYFPATNQTLVIKAIDITEDEHGHYDATAYTEDAFSEDANFENGIFEHRPLLDVINNGKLKN